MINQVIEKWKTDHESHQRSAENSLKDIIHVLPCLPPWLQPSLDIKFSERENSPAHLLKSLTCPGVAVARPLCAQPQIQTHQALQDHLAPLTSTAASGLVNQCKCISARGSNFHSRDKERCVFCCCFFFLTALIHWVHRSFSTFIFIWT